MPIDEIDRNILQVLEEDPRISNTKISEIVGLTPQAVGIRIKKLKKARVIGGIKILKPLPKRIKKVREIKRFPTKWMDDHIGGGFPNPSTILLLGESGVGTTTFCLKFLWTAINEGKKCVFFAIERPQENVIQQLKSFGWDMVDNENLKFIDVYEMVNQRVREFENVSHMDILQIYREMIQHQKSIMPKTDIMVFDSFSELIKLVKGSPIEIDLINQLSTYMMKHKGDLISIYVLKPHIIPVNSLYTLETYADAVIRLRNEVTGPRIRRFLLIEKMLLTDHTTQEIEFHITNDGLILEEHLLQSEAIKYPPPERKIALFGIAELDYLTQGLPYGTTWILEIDSVFPLSDLVKLYTNFFINGLERGDNALFSFPRVSLTDIIETFSKSIEATKQFQKTHTTLQDLTAQHQLILLDIYLKSVLLEDKTRANYFKPVQWSSNIQSNLKFLGDLILGGEGTEQGHGYHYLGGVVSDLIGAPAEEEAFFNWYKLLIPLIQKRGYILLATINPQLHSSDLIAKLRFYADGIITLGVSAQSNTFQDKYIQVIKTPQGKPSVPHRLIVNATPPYFQII